jgi:hypothetical protein
VQPDVAFTATELALIAGLLSAVVAALGVVFRAWQREVDQHIAALEQELARCIEDRDWWRTTALQMLQLGRESVEIGQRLATQRERRT